MLIAAMAEDTQQGPLGLGDHFLKYSIYRVVGRGGHAWVYAARDDFFERDVAVKVVDRPSSVTPEMLRRGRAEAQILKRLRHPNVVEVVDAGITNEGQLYVVSELLHGKTLREVLAARGKLSAAETLGLFIAITDGVQAGHDLGAVHRNLKPENLFVLDDGSPKILDFGVAKILDSAGWSNPDSARGPRLFKLPPEQREGARPTVRSDVYAVGLVLYEALLGREPVLLAPEGSEPGALQHVEQPPLLSDVDATIPRHVARTVARALAKLPEKRIASMIELREALTTCLARLESEGQAPEPRRVSRTSAPPKATADTQASVSTPLALDVSTTAELRPLSTENDSRPSETRERGETAPPVTTHAYAESTERDLASPGARRRTSLQVFAACAAAGLLLGLGGFLSSFQRHTAPPSPTPIAAGEPAPLQAPSEPAPFASTFTSPSGAPAVPSSPPVAAASTPAPVASDSLHATPPSAKPRPATAPARSAGAKRKRAPVLPERKVWIE
jgi:serine/threonine-protein kinase